MTFKALLMSEGEGGPTYALTDLQEDQLPDGDVVVDVEYSTLNYKDGMILGGNIGRLVRSLPHVPGVDFAGTVAQSSDPRYAPGDSVVLTGWRVGEMHWGGCRNTNGRGGSFSGTACPRRGMGRFPST